MENINNHDVWVGYCGGWEYNEFWLIHSSTCFWRTNNIQIVLFEQCLKLIVFTPKYIVSSNQNSEILINILNACERRYYNNTTIIIIFIIIIFKLYTTVRYAIIPPWLEAPFFILYPSRKKYKIVHANIIITIRRRVLAFPNEE